jgi:hypothetical protein
MQNRLLAALPKKDYRRLKANVENVSLSLNQTLYESDQLISYVYFPNDCMISLISTSGEESMIEIGMIGNEGIVGRRFSRRHENEQSRDSADRGQRREDERGEAQRRVCAERRTAKYLTALYASANDANLSNGCVQPYSLAGGAARALVADDA